MDLSDALQIARLSDVGNVREHNEDIVASDLEIGIVLVADGIGGYQAGEVASEIAALSIITEVKESLAGNHNALHQNTKLNISPKSARSLGSAKESLFLLNAIKSANRAIFDVAQERPKCEGMGTTIVAGLFCNNKLIVAHVGDSRLYRYRDRQLVQLTEDHSIVQEQIRDGLISPADARNSPEKHLLTRALGVEAYVEVDIQEFDVKPYDIYLLCSDGLSDFVTDEDMALTLGVLENNLEFAAQELVNMANINGGNDNISVILAKIISPFKNKNQWLKPFKKWKN